MHFIDVGFKQSGSNVNNNYYFQTIFYGLNDGLEEVDLYKWEELYSGVKVVKNESALKCLDSSEYDELAAVIDYKKEHYGDNSDYSFIKNLKGEFVKMKKRSLK